LLSNDVENHLRATLNTIPELTNADRLFDNFPSNNASATDAVKLYSAADITNTQKNHPLCGRASVLVPLVQKQDGWHIILTLRAKNMRHHGGEVAFPGGMWEEGDRTLVDTALRECEEEIAIAPSNVTVLGGLNSAPTRGLTLVRPVVGMVKSLSGLTANPSEIADIFTVPIDFFRRDKRFRTDVFHGRKTAKKSDSLWAPAYRFHQYEIWGFTASVIVQLVNRSFGTTLVRENPAPEKIW
jgi:8-oxo-dGTP pyrophosphatase MutT (NUDIX family)